MTYRAKKYNVPRLELASVDGCHWTRPSRYCYILRRDSDRRPVAVMTRGGCYGWVVRVPHPDRTDRDWHHSEKTRYMTSAVARRELLNPAIEGRTVTSNSVGESEEYQREAIERGRVWNYDGSEGELTAYPYLPSGDMEMARMQHRSAMLPEDATEEELDAVIDAFEAKFASRPGSQPLDGATVAALMMARHAPSVFVKSALCPDNHRWERDGQGGDWVLLSPAGDTVAGVTRAGDGWEPWIVRNDGTRSTASAYPNSKEARHWANAIVGSWRPDVIAGDDDPALLQSAS